MCECLDLRSKRSNPSLSLFSYFILPLNSFISSYGTDNGSYEKFINKVEN